MRAPVGSLAWQEADALSRDGRLSTGVLSEDRAKALAGCVGVDLRNAHSHPSEVFHSPLGQPRLSDHSAPQPLQGRSRIEKHVIEV